MAYDKPITIQKIDNNTEVWSDFLSLHAEVNKTKQTAYLSAGASQSKRTLTFKLRYCPPLDDIANDTQLYRIYFHGKPYKIIDHDDFMLRHLDVKLVGESY